MINIKRILKIVYYQLCDTLGRSIRKKFTNYTERRRLRCQKVSIISQNCTGSIWYHDLNLPFYSPTIKMKFDGNDFIKFLKEMPRYLDSDFTFYRNEEGQLKGVLGGDIKMSFIHWNNPKDVTEKWEKRKKRITSPIIVLGFAEDMTDESIYEYISLNIYPNRLLFIDSNRAKSLGLKENEIVRYVPAGYDNANQLNFCDLVGHRFYQRAVDYIEYINSAK